MENSTSKKLPNRNHLWIGLAIGVVILLGYLQNAWQSDIDALETALASSQSAQSSLEDALATERLALSQFKDQVTHAQSSEVSLLGQLVQLQSEFEAISQSQKQASQLLNDRTAALDEQGRKTQELQAALVQKNLDLNAQNALYTSLNQQYLSQLSQIEALSESKDSIASQYLSARQQIALQQSKSQDYSDTIATLQQELDNENSAMTDLSQLLNRLTETNEALVRKLENGSTMIELPERVLFQSGSATINTQGLQTINLLVTALRSFPNHIISVQGHSDSRPIAPVLQTQFPSNWELSAARAAAAVRVLVDSGIAANRLQAVGFADSKPLVQEVNASTRAQNRRIEILLVPQLKLVPKDSL